MKYYSMLAAIVAFAFSTLAASAQNLNDDGSLPRSTPEAVGLDSGAIADAIKRLDQQFNRVDAVMILRDGKVVAEAWRPPFGSDVPHPLYSLSKSFVSTAVGFAVAEGKLSVNQKIVEFFPDDMPENPDPKLKEVSLRDLLTMSCGNDSDPWPPEMMGTDYGLDPILSDAEPTWARQFLSRKIVYDPGTRFVYNTTGTYMCSAIVQKAVGERVVDYLTPRLFEPLHIDKPYWEESPQGVDKGGVGLFLKTEDIAKFGQLYLQKGVWNGERLLPEAWIDEATSAHISNGDDPDSDWAQGYGYQFWRCRHNVYRGDGMYCQFCVVMPDQNMVVAINSDCGDYQGILNVLFDVLIPAAKDAPLPENPDALAKLREVERSLLPKEGQSGSAVLEMTMPSVALKRDVRYRVYIPNGYRTTSGSYPTLYLLHGLGGSEKDWSDPERGDMRRICDEHFARYPEQKRIVVMPDGGDDWYRDSADDSCKYETFFFDELIPEVQRRFRCKRDARDRAIAGLSMGGYGALLYATRRPEVFDSCCAMSPAVRLKDEIAGQSFDEFLIRYRSRADQKEGETERFDDYFYENDPHTLVTKLSDDAKRSLRFLVDCGDDDSLLVGAVAFFQEARQAGVACELRVRDGAHAWKYWRESLPIALDFIARQK